MLPLRARVDMGAMAMKGYSAYSKSLSLPLLHHHIIDSHMQDIRWWGVLPLWREAVGVFYSPSRLGNCANYLFYIGIFNIILLLENY